MSDSHDAAVTAPVWLAHEPAIRSLLAAVVDRFDEQPSEQRVRAIVLPVARHLPALQKNDAAADQAWAFIEELQDLGVLSIRTGRRGAYDAPWDGAKLAFAPASEGLLRRWLDRPRSASALQRWRVAVASRADQFPGGSAPLLARRIHVAGRSPEEVISGLASLSRIDQPATLRQLSTYAFWGDSKVLDDRGELVAALFPQLSLRERPLVVAVHLPERIDGVLFIENQDTYTAALTGEPAESKQHALVYMAGFRGAALRIRSRDGACLHFSGSGVANGAEQFERWWFDPAGTWGSAEPADIVRGLPLAFWGDLDFAGLQILKSLRERFGEVVAWRPGYEPMLRDLRCLGRSLDSSLERTLEQDREQAREGTQEPIQEQTLEPVSVPTPEGAGERVGELAQGQVDPGWTGCPYADNELLPAVRRLGFWHQERIAGLR